MKSVDAFDDTSENKIWEEELAYSSNEEFAEITPTLAAAGEDTLWEQRLGGNLENQLEDSDSPDAYFDCSDAFAKEDQRQIPAVPTDRFSTEKCVDTNRPERVENHPRELEWRMADDYEQRRLAASIGGVIISSEPHEYTLPEEALLFEPSEEDIMENGLRYIYLNTPLTDYEQTALSALHRKTIEMDDGPTGHACTPQVTESNKHGFDMEQPVNLVRNDFLRFLYSANFDVTYAARLVHENYVYRSRNLPVSEASVAEGLKSAGVYWHGRDKNLRPLLVVKIGTLSKLEALSQHGKTECKEVRITRLLMFCIEFFLRYLTVAGRVENWNVLIDCQGKGLSNFPTGTLKCILDALNTKYRGRLYRMYIINFPRWIGWLTNFVMGLVSSATARKIAFVPNAPEYKTRLRELYSRAQLERRYGGTAPDLGPGETYPFRFFAGPYNVSTESASVDRQLYRTLHAMTSLRIHVGSLWELPLPLRSYRDYVRSKRRAANGGTDQDVGALPTRPFALEKIHIEYLQTHHIWVRYVHLDRLSDRAAFWLGDYLGLQAKAVRSVEEALGCSDNEDRYSPEDNLFYWY